MVLYHTLRQLAQERIVFQKIAFLLKVIRNTSLEGLVIVTLSPYILSQTKILNFFYLRMPTHQIENHRFQGVLDQPEL